MTIIKKPRVISYTRFSSRKQSMGRSEERQGDSALMWCKENNFTLDENISDLGVSAFRGKHRTQGALSAFLKSIEEGKVPVGSYLLIEHFDRLTREEIDAAQELVKKILRQGVNIVTLLDQRVYTKQSLNNVEALLVMIMMFGQAHDESRKKGDRVAATFQRKRTEGRKVFGAAPGWLRRKPGSMTGEWEVVPGLAEVVVKVFELSAKGMGGPSIARLANQEKWLVPTRKTTQSTNHWHSRMPQILLRNRAVLGEMQFWLSNRTAREAAQNDVGHSIGEVIKDYYPRVIDDKLWHLAKAAIDARKTVPLKRDQNYFNVFAGLMRCGHCGGSVQRKVEIRGSSRGQLVCSNKMAGLEKGKTKCKTASAYKTDQQLIRDICSYAGASLGLGYDKEAANDEIVVATAKLVEVSEQLSNITKLIKGVKGPVQEFIDISNELISDREQLEALIEDRRRQLVVDPNSLFDTTYADEVIAILYEKSDQAKLKRADFNARLHRAVAAIWLWSYDVAQVQFKHGFQVLTIPLPTKAKGDGRPAWEASLKGELELPGLVATQ